MIDICVNLQNGQFSENLSTVLERAHEAGVSGILGCATDLTLAQRNITLCEESLARPNWPELLSTAGVHPHDAETWQDSDDLHLATLCQSPWVRAVGECGLDFNRNYSAPTAQRKAFQAQIAIACQVQKPLFVHDRDSDGEVLGLLKDQDNLPPVVIHCFTGSAAELDGYLEAGFFIGITGWLCDAKRGQTLRELVARIPNDRILVETDAPFLRPHNAPPNDQLFANTEAALGKYRRRNEPALLNYVLSALAEQRKQSPTELAEFCAANANTLFGFNHRPADPELLGG